MDAEGTLIAAVDVTPAVTAERWNRLSQFERPRQFEWSRFLALAIQHRVEGLVVDAFTILQAADLLPPSAWTVLKHRSRLARERTDALVAAAQRVEEMDSGFFSGLTLYKGMTMVGRYREQHHRMVSDLDAVVAEHQMPRVRRVLNDAGFVEKQGFRGSAFYAEPHKPQIGVDHVLFDLHFEPLPRFASASAREHIWSDGRREPFSLGGGVDAVRFGVNESLLIALVHLAEHAASWIHVCVEDDVRMIKALDVELLCLEPEVNAARLLYLARTLGVLGSATMGAAWIRVLRGEVPLSLQPLLSGPDVDDLLDLIALPDGQIGSWTVPAAERVFLSDRRALALGMMGGGQTRVRDWYDPAAVLPTVRERVGAIVDRANTRCIGTSPGWSVPPS